MPLIASKVTYEFAPAEIKELIVQHLKVDSEKVTVRYVIREVDADPMDRYRGRDEVVSIEVTVQG